MIKYWQLSLNVICDSLYRLTGRELSEDEQYRIILFGILGPLYDDLFDDGILDHPQIEAFTLEPEGFVAEGFEQYAVKQAYLQLLAKVPQRQHVIRHLHEVFLWQKASLQQMQNTIGEEELYRITYEKSYCSFLLCYSILDHYPEPAILEMLYPAAGLLQLTNDIFDVYKDIQGGIYTVPNLYRDFDKLRSRFMSDVAQLNQRLQQLPYQTREKKIFGITIHALHAMGCIAMEQLQKTTRDVAALTELSREQLVCDMDSFFQKVRWIRQVQYLVNYG